MITVASFKFLNSNPGRGDSLGLCRVESFGWLFLQDCGVLVLEGIGIHCRGHRQRRCINDMGCWVGSKANGNYSDSKECFSTHVALRFSRDRILTNNPGGGQ